MDFEIKAPVLKWLMSIGVIFALVISHKPITSEFAFAQAAEAWVSRYNGPINGNDYASGLAVDDAGNVYVTGTTTGSGGAGDYATVKYDANGNQLWSMTYNGPGDFNDYALAIVVDKAGNAYVTGESTGLDGFYDFATIKYDTDGNTLWVARYNGPVGGWDYAVAIALDRSNNVYVTGYQTDVDGTSNSGYVTVKYDTGGNQLWVATYNGLSSGADRAVAIAIDAAGYVYVTGSSAGLNGTSDYATIKYDADGNELWVARYSFSNWQKFPAALAVDIAGYVYLTGYTVAPFNPQDPNSTNSDYATVKYDANGNEMWVARYNGPGSSFYSSIDTAVDIAVDAAGHVYVTGQSESAGPSVDYTTIKYDGNGSELWVVRYEGIGNGLNFPVKLALDAKGYIYVTGYSGGSNGSPDYATVKYDANGNELWVDRYNGTGNRSDTPVALTVGASDNAYVTGSSDGLGTFSDYATIKLPSDNSGSSGNDRGSIGGDSSGCFIETAF
jgi:uncharacterized protein YfiM (DUF2279 family)